jgi:NitT/TauT family transport system permease protein
MVNFINKNKGKLLYFIGTMVIIIIWWILSITLNNQIILPKISSVLSSFFRIISKLDQLIIIGNTVLRLVISVLIGLGFSFILVILFVLYPPILSFFTPILTLCKTTPVASIIIIILIWIGSEYSPVLITSLVIFPLMSESMVSGIKTIDKSYMEELKLNGGMSRYALGSVIMPLIYPHIFLGIIQSFGLGLKVMVMAELFSQTQISIGNQLYISKVYLNMSDLFAWTIVLILLVIGFEYLISKARKKIIQTQ